MYNIFESVCAYKCTCTCTCIFICSFVHAGVLSGHDGPVRMCCFSRDGMLIASASGDQTIRVWETTSMKCLNVFDKHDCRFVNL